MSKRRQGDRAKAVEDAGGGRAYRTASEGYAAGRAAAEAGKTLVQLTAERMAETRFLDMMAAGGVGHDRMALEVLYWLPRGFVDLYQELYTRGLANTDGGTGARGQAGAEAGAVGKAKGKTGGGKKFKKYWVVQDEDVLELKSRIDKRLRALEREVRGDLAEMDFRRSRGEKLDRVVTNGEGRGEERPVGSTRPHCTGCGIIVASIWNFCSKCGHDLRVDGEDGEGVESMNDEAVSE